MATKLITAFACDRTRKRKGLIKGNEWKVCIVILYKRKVNRKSRMKRILKVKKEKKTKCMERLVLNESMNYLIKVKKRISQSIKRQGRWRKKKGKERNGRRAWDCGWSDGWLRGRKRSHKWIADVINREILLGGWQKAKGNAWGKGGW